MDFNKIEVLHPNNITASVGAGGTGVGAWNINNEFVFAGTKNILTFAKPIKDYAWIEVTVDAQNNDAGSVPLSVTGQYLASADGNYSGQVTPNISQFGEATYRIPNLQTLAAIVLDNAAAANVTLTLRSIKIVQKVSQFSQVDAVPLGRGSVVGGGFVYNAALGCYEGTVLAAGVQAPQFSFVGLVNGLEYGVVRILDTTGQDCRVATIWGDAGGPVSFFGHDVEFFFSGDASKNMYPNVLTLTNPNGPGTCNVRIYLQLGTFGDTNVSAFGANAQTTQTPTSLFSALGLSALTTGWLFANAGILTGFAAIPVTSVDFTAGVVNVENVNTLNVLTTAAIKDLKVTRTGNVFGTTLGQMWYTDAGGFLTPTDGSLYAMRPDLYSIGFGSGILNGIGLNLDISNTVDIGLNGRYGMRIFCRTPLGLTEPVIVGVITDLNAANVAYTLSGITHFWANTSNAAAPATITTAIGFYASATMARGSTNRGFHSDISNATNTWQLTMTGTAPSYFSSEVGLGSSISGTGGSLLFMTMAGAPLAGGADKIGISIRNQAPSSATTNVIGVQSFGIGSATAAITLTTLTHFWAQSSTLGAGSTISAVYGFRASNAMAVGSNNAGFWSDINNAANTQQLFMSGTAQSIFNGTVVFGTGNTGGTANSIRFGLPATVSSADVWACYGLPTYTSSATSTGGTFVSEPLTANSAFTLGNLLHFWAKTTTKGAASTISNVYGFQASNGIVVSGATNIGFGSDINSASNTYQLRMTGTAISRFNGPVGLSTDPSSNVLLQASVSGLSAVGSVGVYVAGTFPATVITTAIAFQTQLATANSAVTYAEVTGFRVDTWTKGAASTITGAYGFRVENNFAVGSSNFGFYSAIANAANTWQSYMSGTGISYFGGPVQIGNPVSANLDAYLRVGAGTTHPSLSTAIYGSHCNYITPSTATASSYGHMVNMTTPATAFTVNIIAGFVANNVTKGAGSTINLVYGFYADNAIAGAGTTTYGYYSNLAAGSGVLQIAMLGTAPNWFKGGLVLDTTAASTAGAGTIMLGATTATTVGAAGAAAALPANPLGYWIINVAGTAVKVPYYN